MTLGVMALALGNTATASADSIVHIKDGNVWLTSPDGASQRQVTSGGNWHSPTQADDGTIAAVQGTIAPITVMNGFGQVVRTVTTPPAATSNGGTFAPAPVDLDFSPDASKIAYEYATLSCPPASSCGSRNSVFYTHADRPTPIAEFGNQFGRGDPSWVSGSRALTFGGYLHHVNLDDIGGGDSSDVHWFDDQDVFAESTDLSDGELRRSRDALALIRGYDATAHIQLYRVRGDPSAGGPPAPPESACIFEPLGARYDDPTWSPDGGRLAFANDKGIEVATLPSLAEGCPGASFSETPVVAGGSSPDWGPAEVPVGIPPGSGDDGGTPHPHDPPVRQTKLQRQIAQQCGRLKGSRRKLCVARVKAVYRCSKITKAKRRKLCVKRAKAVAKCKARAARSKKAKARKAACLRKANRIGKARGRG